MKIHKLEFKGNGDIDKLVGALKLLIESDGFEFVCCNSHELSVHPLIDFIHQKYEWMSGQIKSGKLKAPTFEQCELLKHKYKKSYIVNALASFENHQYKKLKTVYLTVDNWLSKTPEAIREHREVVKKEVELPTISEEMRAKLNEKIKGIGRMIVE